MNHLSRLHALVRAALLVGLVACSKKEEAKPAPLPPPPAPLSHRDDETPPPPEAEVEAPKVEAPTAHGGGAASPYTGCEPKVCKGTETEELTQTLAGRARMARSCYEMALRNDPTLQGSASFKVRISPGGTVCSANVAKDEIHNPAVLACSAKRLSGAGYPKPKGGCVDVTVPISFKPR